MTLAHTVSLFYGEGAEDKALEAAENYGKIIKVLGTEKGVRKDDSREMNLIHNAPPVSDYLGAVVIGPMDLATVDASDALLKVIEEPSDLSLPFLWANDVGQVSKTIRSRCRCVWVYQASEDYEYPCDLDLLDQAMAGDGLAIAELLINGDPKKIMEAAVYRLSARQVSTHQWQSYKAVLGSETTASVSSALMAGSR